MSLDPTQQTLNNLTARLLDEESSLASVEEQETALLVVNKGWKNVPKQNGPRSCGSGTSQNKTTKHRFECYNCGKRGHFSKECRFPKQNKPRKHLKESSDMLAFNVEISSYNTEENAWIMDSGASAHMTFRKDFFVELLKCSEKSLTLGNKQSVEVSGIGKVLIKRYVNGQWETSELHGVLYVPNLRRNLFSEGVIIRKGYTIMKKDSNASIYKDKKNGNECQNHRKQFI
ncbi:Retrovirus-related Pol polyprotein from transposon TNT 1-94 [Eumeta japonica]|uniref:Retrovirus-related Pol polyprotein from transposon TNT 1-94 n=1 Tax=Eumeta variegata TaxID=151549 RepID=A0A4C2A936_EUMVA|nr:Retrovirus-related Pol polyprotein from transposon TNT 1-94 [Eumeta japonica]